MEQLTKGRLQFIVGWQEWCGLPELNIPAICAKIDTGAKTSALHAFDIVPSQHGSQIQVSFNIHPLRNTDTVKIQCRANVIDQRMVMNSGGIKEERYVIVTPILLGGVMWPIEVTLTNRDPMRFRMLLGREALNQHVLVDPAKRLYCSRASKKQLLEMYGS